MDKNNQRLSDALQDLSTFWAKQADALYVQEKAWSEVRKYCHKIRKNLANRRQQLVPPKPRITNSVEPKIGA